MDGNENVNVNTDGIRTCKYKWPNEKLCSVIAGEQMKSTVGGKDANVIQVKNSVRDDFQLY